MRQMPAVVLLLSPAPQGFAMKLPGRLRGGLSRLGDRMHLWAFLTRHRSLWVRLGWNVAGGAVGCLIGLLGVTLWLKYR